MEFESGLLERILMEPEQIRSISQFTKKEWLVILLLSVFISPFVAAITSSFFPALGSLIATFVVISMCLLVSRMPEDEHYSRSILLSITTVIVISPYICAFFCFRVDLIIHNRTGTHLGNVVVSYPWYFDDRDIVFVNIAPGESFRLHPCILYGEKNIRIKWNNDFQSRMKEPIYASFSGAFDRFGRNELTLLGEENLVRNQEAHNNR